MNGIKHAAAMVVVSAAAALASNIATAAAGTNDEAMLALATHSGCLTCHSVKPVPTAAGSTKPVGPAWQEVARKYHGQKDAAQRLTATVMQGSNPYASHWKGKVSGLAMPPNAVAIRRDEARRLVQWILSLDGRES